MVAKAIIQHENNVVVLTFISITNTVVIVFFHPIDVRSIVAAERCVAVKVSRGKREPVGRKSGRRRPVDSVITGQEVAWPDHDSAERTEVGLATPKSAPRITRVLKNSAIIRGKDRGVVAYLFV